MLVSVALLGGSAAGVPGVAAEPVDRGGGGATTRVSVADDGAQAGGDSTRPSISADGRYVAFASLASNLVPGDTNESWDVFVRDRTTGTTRLVSVSSSGVQGSDASAEPSISADGRFVAFWSASPDLVPDDTNGSGDIFVHDLQTDTTERVSVRDDEAQIGRTTHNEAVISGNGRFVLFEEDASSHRRPVAFVRDREAGTTQSIPSFREADISEQGRFVAFSTTQGLAPTDDDGVADVYLLDRRTGTTRLVSTTGYFRNDFSMSGDGRYIVYVAASKPRVRYGAQGQVYVRDTRKNTTRIASVNSRGVPGNDGSFKPVLSRDGHYVVFRSSSTNLVPRAMRLPQLFGHDLRTGATRVISVSSFGEGSDRGAGEGTAVSATGRVVAFASGGRNLVPGDTNRSSDVFVRVRRPR